MLMPPEAPAGPAGATGMPFGGVASLMSDKSNYKCLYTEFRMM